MIRTTALFNEDDPIGIGRFASRRFAGEASGPLSSEFGRATHAGNSDACVLLSSADRPYVPAWSALWSIASDSRPLELLIEFAELLELPSVRLPQSCAFMKRAFSRKRLRAIAADQYAG